MAYIFTWNGGFRGVNQLEYHSEHTVCEAYLILHTSFTLIGIYEHYIYECAPLYGFIIACASRQSRLNGATLYDQVVMY